LSSRLKLLERMGYPGAERILSPEGMKESAALIIAAALLRQNFPNAYDIRDLGLWMNQHGIDQQDLMRHVTQMIETPSTIKSILSPARIKGMAGMNDLTSLESSNEMGKIK